MFEPLPIGLRFQYRVIKRCGQSRLQALQGRGWNLPGPLGAPSEKGKSQSAREPIPWQAEPFATDRSQQTSLDRTSPLPTGDHAVPSLMEFVTRVNAPGSPRLADGSRRGGRTTRMRRAILGMVSFQLHAIERPSKTSGLDHAGERNGAADAIPWGYSPLSPRAKEIPCGSSSLPLADFAWIRLETFPAESQGRSASGLRSGATTPTTGGRIRSKRKSLPYRTRQRNRRIPPCPAGRSSFSCQRRVWEPASFSRVSNCTGMLAC